MDVIWEKCLNIIKETISQQNFDTWIRPIKMSSIEDNAIRLLVPNRFFKDWLEENHSALIAESLTTLIGTPIHIIFSVQPTKDPEPDPIPRHLSPPQVKVQRRSMTNPRIHPSLNQQYTFERFIVGSCNQFAHAASMAVSEQPAKSYNPLFIYGGVGLGKTHLLNAIGLRTLTMHAHMNVLYVSAEEFMNELVNSIRYDKMPKFREKYRNIECLLIDDVQFIAGKERTQEEFFHTFNTLHDSGKQIVVTSDQFPKDIPHLEGRLRSRFEWGLIADIQPPEMETKIAIVEKKAQENNITLPSNVTHFIASHSESNIRELEGYLVRIAAYASLTGRSIDLPLAQEVLKKLTSTEKEKVSIEQIMKIVASKFGVKVHDIKSQKKNKNLATARQIAMYVARQCTSHSYPDIGEKIGGRDHSTVIYAYKKIHALIDTDNRIQKIVQEIMDAVQK